MFSHLFPREFLYMNLIEFIYRLNIYRQCIYKVIKRKSFTIKLIEICHSTRLVFRVSSQSFEKNAAKHEIDITHGNRSAVPARAFVHEYMFRELH